MNYWLPVILIISFSGNLFSQTAFDRADSIAKRVKASDITTLHHQLTKHLSADEEKVRAFYFWIAQNIKYDVSESLKSEKNTKKQESEVVLNSKKAICHGYSVLFLDLCSLSSIPCFLVSGYTRIGGKFDNAGHTWNVVYVKDKWQPVDVTWGAGGVNDRGIYVGQFTDKYFLTAPLDFLSDHYPFDPMWQLVFYPLPADEFRKANWIYQEANKTYFNYNDTIQNWLKFDSLDREYHSVMRMARFNPGDPVIKLQLSYTLLEKGNAEFENGNKFMAVLFPVKQAGSGKPSDIQDKSSRIAHLDSIELHYTMAELFYKQVKLHDATEQAVLRSNVDALKFNSDVVRKEKLRLINEDTKN